MGESPFFKLGNGQFERLDVDFRRFVVGGDDFQGFAPADDGNFVIVEIDYFVSVLDNGGGVGGQEGLPVADTDHKGGTLAGADNRVGIFGVDYGNGIGADNLLEGLADGLDQRAVVGLLDIFDELYKHLGVGLALEGASLEFKRFLKDAVILYRTVVDQGDTARAADMGMGVYVVGLSVGCPAGMGDADASLDVFRLAEAFEVVDLSAGFIDIEVSFAVDHSDTGAVITAVFQAVESFDKNLVCGIITNIPYYSTHI